MDVVLCKWNIYLIRLHEPFETMTIWTCDVNILKETNCTGVKKQMCLIGLQLNDPSK